MKMLLLFGLMLAVLAGCGTARNAPKKSAFKSPTNEPSFKGALGTPLDTALILARLEREIMALKGGDTAKAINLNVVFTLIDTPKMQALKVENHEIRKRRELWRVLAGVFFAIATGHLLSEIK